MNLEKNSYCSINDLKYKIRKKIILNNINFQVPYNKSTFILGNNGSGKSTLLDIITRNIKPNRGEIFIKKDSKFKNNLGVLYDSIPFLLQ